MSPHHEAARRGLVAATRAVVEAELPRDPRAAAALLAAVREPVPDLEERIRVALTAENTQRAADARVARDHDTRIGIRWRTVFRSSGLRASSSARRSSTAA